MDWLDLLRVVGALGTAFSVAWAIFTFRRSEDRRLFAGTRDTLGNLRSDISRLDSLMSEPEFARIASQITARIRELKPPDWSLDQFNEFLSLDDGDARSYVAHAIHQGRLECGTIARVEEITRGLLEVPSKVKEPFPLLHLALKKLLYYIIQMGNFTVSPRLYNLGLNDVEHIKQTLVPELQKHMDHENFYFAELRTYISTLPHVALRQNQFGQSTFDEAEKIIGLLVETFSRMSDAELRKSSKTQKSSFQSVCGIHQKHAVEDAVAVLQPIRSHFSNEDWDTIVSSKTKILTLMDSDDKADD